MEVFKIIKILILTLLIVVGCGEQPNYTPSRVVSLPNEDAGADKSAKIIFATPHPDGQYCFYEAELNSSRQSDNAYLRDNCELLTSSSIARGDLANAVAGNSRWANIRANFYVMPLASSVACLVSMLLLVKLNGTYRALLCGGYIASFIGIYFSSKALKKEATLKIAKIMSSSNHVLDTEDYHHLRRTFSVLQSSNSTPCPRKPKFAQPKKAEGK